MEETAAETTPTEVAPVSEEVPESEPAEDTEEVGAGEEEGEPEEGEETGEPKGPQKKSASERIQQLIDERNADRAKLEALEAKLNERLAAEEAAKKPFHDVPKERFDAYVAQAMEHIDELKDDGRYVEALELQENLFTLRKEWQENEKKKAEWESKQQEQSTVQKSIQQNAHSVQVAAQLYREQNGIDERAWVAGMDAFSVEAKKNPALSFEFRDLVEKQGAMAAVRFAHKVVMEASKPAQEAIQKREEAKGKVPSAAGTKAAPAKRSIYDKSLSMDEWIKLREAS